MIKWFHTVTGDPYTKVSLLRSKVSYVISFFYRIFQVISSTSRNWFPGNFYRMMEWDNFCRQWRKTFLEAFKISANSINLFLPSSFNPLIMLYGFSPKKDSYISSISSNWQSVRKTCKAGSRALVSHLEIAFVVT